MSDGVAAVLARMQQLDGQLRSVDPTWIGLTPGTFGATADWVSSPTFGQALAAAGAAQGTPGAAQGTPGAAPAVTTGPGSAIAPEASGMAATPGMPTENAVGTGSSDTPGGGPRRRAELGPRAVGRRPHPGRGCGRVPGARRRYRRRHRPAAARRPSRPTRGSAAESGSACRSRTPASARRSGRAT